MKKISQLLLIVLFGLNSSIFAQSTASKDENRILITSWVPETIEGMPNSARKNLTNKLKQVVTKNGLGGSPYNTRFIISADVNVVSKDILPGPPPMHAYNLDITLYIGDGIEGTSFASETISVKGVGTNETKAYLSALKRISPKNPNVQAFVKKGKEKIITYYKDNCDLILKKADVLAKQNEYDAAIYTLNGIPSACEECYVKALDAIDPIFQEKINFDCKDKLQEANTIWSGAQDVAAAEKAGKILASINPNASCAGDARALSDKIAKRVKEIDGREWEYTVKDQQQESERIEAIRAVGVAHGKGPKANVTYRSLY